MATLSFLTTASLGLAAALVACGGSSTPTSPASPSAVVTMTGAPPAPAPTASGSCAAWAAGQRGAGVAAASGTVAAHRQALYDAGGGIRAVGDRYYAAVFPRGFATKRRILVSLHGTGGAPETEWSVDWQHVLPSRDWAYLGLKYADEATGVHDDPDTIYRNLALALDDVRASCDAGSASVYLVGFSRGSAEAFSVSYLDLHGRRLFKAIGNNSGAWPDAAPLPPTLAGFRSRGEATAMAGARHWMYCGEHDMTHGYSMCVEMQAAADFIATYGATVATLYKDPSGTHGGLAKNSDAVSKMLAYFESL